MTKIIALINQKGGVGKTTSTVNIGAGLTKLGKKVLLVDLDPQAHLTYSLGIEAHELENTVYELLKGEAQFKQVLVDRDGLHIIPASLDLSGAEIELSGIPGRELLLKEALETTTNYDFILLDCAPSLGLLTVNALTTAQEVYIPLHTEFLPLQGMSKLLQTVDIVKKRLNRKIQVTGIIATRYDGRKNLHKEVIEKVRSFQDFDKKLFKTFIRENIAIAEAPSFGKTIFEHKPDSNGSEDYLSLCREILNRK